ncbi:MAG: cytochrome c3 family protein [Chloroflexota bacterium]
MLQNIKRGIPFILLLIGLALVAVSCAPQQVEVTVPVEVTRLVEVTKEVPIEPEVEIPFQDLWASSGHADTEAEAFRHWDEDDPPVVSLACAKCHSTLGYLDFLGADGSEAGLVNVEVTALENNGIQCIACHNDVSTSKTSVIMPSGIELTNLGDESRCMECHQGRESKLSVDNRIAEAAGVETAQEADPDTVLADLGFANVHYFAAAATKYGTFAKGGYEYDGKAYDGVFAHVEEFDTCFECHDSHSLQVRAEACVLCHGEGEFQDFRMEGSAMDYDEDGDITEGIAYEIAGLQEKLYAEIQAYATGVAGIGIVYDVQSYPYFFIDTDGNGTVTEGEATYSNRYVSWTPRLLRAAYNYQFSLKDPGAFAHGGKYIIQLLCDSIEDLNADAACKHRSDAGHFDGSADAFRHWDPGTRADGVVSASCAKCHSADGLPFFLKEGINVSTLPSNGFMCSTCHDGANWPARYEVAATTFPSGVKIDSGNPDNNLCMSCHQGQESGASVNEVVTGKDADTVLEGQSFINVHYFAAGATRYGSEVGGGFEFPGKEYVGYFEHVPGYQSCTNCHDAHELEVQKDACLGCHVGVEDVTSIRMSAVDYDGDGDVTEGMAGEIETLIDALYAAMQTYTAGNEATAGIVYNPGRYPYFFDEAGKNYSTWTPTLLEAAYNYQFALKDPGGFAHNAKYIIQLLIDSIEALGGDVSEMTRP